jgi:hypothetical protein
MPMVGMTASRMRCLAKPQGKIGFFDLRALGCAGTPAKRPLTLWDWRTAYPQSRAMDVTTDRRRSVETVSG